MITPTILYANLLTDLMGGLPRSSQLRYRHNVLVCFNRGMIPSFMKCDKFAFLKVVPEVGVKAGLDFGRGSFPESSGDILVNLCAQLSRA